MGAPLARVIGISTSLPARNKRPSRPPRESAIPSPDARTRSATPARARSRVLSPPPVIPTAHPGGTCAAPIGVPPQRIVRYARGDMPARHATRAGVPVVVEALANASARPLAEAGARRAEDLDPGLA